jgi:hypothetical protein
LSFIFDSILALNYGTIQANMETRPTQSTARSQLQQKNEFASIPILSSTSHFNHPSAPYSQHFYPELQSNTCTYTAGN